MKLPASAAMSVVSFEGSRPDPVWHRVNRYGSDPQCGTEIQRRYARTIDGDPPEGARRCRRCRWDVVPM